MTKSTPTLPFHVAVQLDTPFYSDVGEALTYGCTEMVRAGLFVQVPLGGRKAPSTASPPAQRLRLGLVWDCQAAPETAADDEPPPFTIRPVHAVWQGLPPLAAEWMRLCEFAAHYYQRSVGEVALSSLPGQLRQLDEAQLAKRLNKLRQPSAEPSPHSPDELTSLPPPELRPAQSAALAAIVQARTPVLLHGVTGSGKTEVYLRAVAHHLAQNPQAQCLVLVPEINLTPQLQAQFVSRFGSAHIVTLHSGLTPAQRLKNWLSAHLGLARVVLGTRLGVFASMPHLSLIVVDEEHDPSYKQQEGARYSARDLAIYRAHQLKIPVVLGSATPSLESWYASERGRYQRVSMPERMGNGAMPKVVILDMNTQPKGTVLAPSLLKAIAERIDRGEQSLLFLNRRGYAPVLHCRSCGWLSHCPHCSAFRVFHRVDRSLRCHHCSLTQAVPRACPECGNPDVTPLGQGTEQLEETLHSALPGVRLARIDADSTRLKGSLEAQLAQVHDGEVDVLIGTQMVTKGHDFRRITLVAAVNADASLYASDIRASERLFALLMQAAGRAGREANSPLRSSMVVQTWHPDHPLFAALRADDYAGFAQQQLHERQAAGLPPFTHLALLRAEGRTQAQAQDWLTQARALGLQSLQRLTPLTPANQDPPALTFYPPVPMSMQRVANVERAQMLIEASHRGQLQQLLSHWTPLLHGSGHKILRWALDVDPLDI